jgi:opacity protein-like surface antigen
MKASARLWAVFCAWMAVACAAGAEPEPPQESEVDAASEAGSPPARDPGDDSVAPVQGQAGTGGIGVAGSQDPGSSPDGPVAREPAKQ